MGDTTISVSEERPDTWRVTAEVRFEGLAASGAYLTHEQPAGEDPAHAGLARAQAWQSLGQQHLEAQRADPALTCARRGLAAIGDDYASPMANDDTGMKIYAAEDLIAKGDSANGAGTLLRALASRIALYRELHQLEQA